MRGLEKRVLVTGAAGMLGTALCPALLQQGFQVLKTDMRPGDKETSYLDVSSHDGVWRSIQESRSDVVIHLAAETDVDKCEIEENHAYRVNTLGTENVALACQTLDIPMVYLSTGAVFDGAKPEAYTESDEPSPINVYGKTKWEGEEIVRSLIRRHFVIRAGWMFGGWGKDKKFVAKMVDLLQRRKEISVVTDKFGSPTFTKDLSENLIRLIQTERYGLYHMANQGGCSRYEMAQEIAEYLGKKDVVLKPVTSEAFPLPAPRCRSEVLLNQQLKLSGLDEMKPWSEALKEYVGTFQRQEMIVPE